MVCLEWNTHVEMWFFPNIVCLDLDYSIKMSEVGFENTPPGESATWMPAADGSSVQNSELLN